jgi:hypothetical protein
MYPSVGPALRTFLGQYEGVVDYMYADTATPARITTGIGNVIDSVARARSYHWQLDANPDQQASAGQVDANWRAVAAHRPEGNLGARHFRQFNTIHLSPDAIEQMFTNAAAQCDRELSRIFSEYNTFPADAQLGMLVHAWALGTHKMNAVWHNYRDACLARDWETAGRECIWRQLRANTEHARGRREALLQMFHNAAEVEAQIRARTATDVTRVYFPGTVPPAVSVTPTMSARSRREPDPLPLHR